MYAKLVESGTTSDVEACLCFLGFLPGAGCNCSPIGSIPYIGGCIQGGTPWC